ncbi:type I restriction and modification enzyme subunit R-like protein [Chromohalobacter marismortui]|uniref:Type I restriction and modification enzyme subunit R-like protein n=1 Tax=Chromohalobacter marismortui TaxID=42055 RepID=A0A4R7NSP8_9GAMM|nr:MULTISPECIES: type I restriction enzyme HsdR N-terminal domain-containing protein [Chromohalobacter]MCI0509210.1 type I restriction enzyme HsdR N-terminal domain-containing protein [Chromohalobacter sp.]TDU23898.1 type I restriction and modification enzyme subunit R-like protein [Chromohalobacter marismortui]
MDNKTLSERDICTKFITPAIQQAGWQQSEFREVVRLTDVGIMVRGKLVAPIRDIDAKGSPKRADYVLYARPNMPIEVIEAKQARFSIGHGMQQALVYAEMLNAPFALSCNGGGFPLHDRIGFSRPIERELKLDQFPQLAALWRLYQEWRGFAGPCLRSLPITACRTPKTSRYWNSRPSTSSTVRHKSRVASSATLNNTPRLYTSSNKYCTTSKSTKKPEQPFGPEDK